MICSVCQSLPGTETLVLTLEEKEYVRKMSRAEPPEEYHYCAGCWRILQDRKAGAKLIQGQLARILYRNGLKPDSSEKLYRLLVGK